MEKLDTSTLVNDGGKNGNNYLKNNQDTKFAKAIKEYGWENFEHYILMYCLEKDLYKLEKEFIKEKRSFVDGYNSSAGLGCEVSMETRKKQSISQKGHKVSEKILKTIEKINMEYKHIQKSGKENPAARAVIMINYETGEELKKFDTIKEASEFAKIKSSSNIGKCCIGKVKTVGSLDGVKLSWKFADEKFITKRNKHLSENHKDLISKSKKGKNIGKDSIFSKEIDMIDSETNVILKTFSNAREAAEFLKQPGITSHIRACCNLKRKTSGKLNGKKLTWRYSSNGNEESQD